MKVHSSQLVAPRTDKTRCSGSTDRGYIRQYSCLDPSSVSASWTRGSKSSDTCVAIGSSCWDMMKITKNVAVVPFIFAFFVVSRLMCVKWT